MHPHEFGYRLGTQLAKQASWGDAAGVAKDVIVGGNPLDPTTRGVAADLALYSNPFTGVATGANDMARHLYNGRFGSALGAVGMGALSFIPGVGGMIGKGVAKGVRGAGKLMGNPGLQRGGAAMHKFVTGGTKAVQQGQQAITNNIQKVIPQRYDALTRAAPIRSTIDAAVRNPAMTATTLGPSLLPNGAATQPMAQPAMQPPLPPPTAAKGFSPAPQSFRPRPMVNF